MFTGQSITISWLKQKLVCSTNHAPFVTCELNDCRQTAQCYLAVPQICVQEGINTPVIGVYDSIICSAITCELMCRSQQ